MRNLVGLATYLVLDGLLTQEEANQVQQEALRRQVSFTYQLVKIGRLSSEDILVCCQEHFSLRRFDLWDKDEMLLNKPLLAPELIYRYRVIPLKKQDHLLVLGLSDPSDHAALDAIQFHLGLPVLPVLLAEDEIEKLIQAYFQPKQLTYQLNATLSKIDENNEIPVNTIEAYENDEPVIHFLDQLIQNAIDKQVSDIHIEPGKTDCRVRFRKDGLLQETAHLPAHLSDRMTARLKIMSNLNIAERRLPQDGRFAQRKNDSPHIDIRINTCPTLYGEKIVLRLLNAAHMKLDIDSLGLLPEQKQLFLSKLAMPQSLILVTGPTGCGKTLTLYSALHYLNQIEKNISSVEDPVEMELSGINQVNVNPKIGLGFGTILRTLLRQDPDIMMIGEIRDAEAASIALQAAQTGHLVLSTLHTNSAIESLIRLQSMKIPTYQLSNAISLLIGQRLLRKLCEYCKIPEELPIEYKAYRAVGCQHCHQGYQGRTGVFELIPMTTTLTKLLLMEANAKQLLNQVKKEGCMTLWQAGLEKVKSGITSYAELIRVVEDSTT